LDGERTTARLLLLVAVGSRPATGPCCSMLFMHNYGEDGQRMMARLLSLDVVDCEQLAHVERSAADP
jgi:hypothetical protein